MRLPAVLRRWNPPWPQDQGCFETMRAYDGRILALDAHLERLWDSARALALPVAETPAAARRAVLNALARARRQATLVRIQLISAG